MGVKRALIDVTPLRESAAFRWLWTGRTLSGWAAITGFGFPEPCCPPWLSCSRRGSRHHDRGVSRHDSTRQHAGRLRGRVTAADDAAGVAVPNLGNLEAG